MRRHGVLGHRPASSVRPSLSVRNYSGDDPPRLACRLASNAVIAPPPVTVFQRRPSHTTDPAGCVMVDSKASTYGVRVVGRRDRKASDGVCRVSML